MFLCSKQPWFFGQKKLWTTYLFNLTIAFYIQLAFKKCISYEWCNSSPKKPLPLDCDLHFYISAQIFDLVDSYVHERVERLIANRDEISIITYVFMASTYTYTLSILPSSKFQPWKLNHENSVLKDTVV